MQCFIYIYVYILHIYVYIMTCSMEYVYQDLSQQMLLLFNQGQDAIVGEFVYVN